MQKQVAVCIAREFGSGGREVGKLVAQKMGMEFYDKELLQKAAEKSGIAMDMFEKADERPTNSLLYSLSMVATGSQLPTSFNEFAYTSNDRLQLYVTQVIREVAESSACVIVGRCADYILRDHHCIFSLFMHADLEKRIERISALHQLDGDAARALIRKTDRIRSNYYSFYTDQDWNNANNYDMALDVGRMGVELAAEITCDALQRLQE